MNKDLLQKRLALAGYTKRELAKKMGMPYLMLCAKLNGRLEFRISEAAQLCHILDIDMAELFMEKGAENGTASKGQD